jgi:hypothetical protein
VSFTINVLYPAVVPVQKSHADRDQKAAIASKFSPGRAATGIPTQGYPLRALQANSIIQLAFSAKR